MNNMYSIDKIKDAFWAYFHESGEWWFNYLGDDEENFNSTNFAWVEFKEKLDKRENKRDTWGSLFLERWEDVSPPENLNKIDSPYREMTPDSMVWNINRGTFVEDNIFTNGYDMESESKFTKEE